MAQLTNRFGGDGAGYPQVASPVAGGPASLDPNSLASFQQNFSRAFIQSAVAQNMQIQQQLMAQNQALQQLLQQSVRLTVTRLNEIVKEMYDLTLH